jgi:tRNA(Ile)-lysidine synthase
MDSVVLLHALVQLRAQLPIRLTALHVNHGISPNAADWAGFCLKTCRSLDVPCDIATLPPVHATGGGLERAAREARYEVFARVDADVLCMAHHMNDRAETLLLNLFRGAGPQGLAAMPSTRFLNGKQLVRPFIDLPRSDLQAWANAQGLSWVEDESNENLHFRRNYLRHVVLPAIGQQFPGITTVLARTAEQMQEQTALLSRLAEADAKHCEDEHGRLRISQWALLPPIAARNVLKHRLSRAGVHIPSARRLEALAAQLVDARQDAEVFVRFGQTGCHLWRDRLWLDHAMNAPQPQPQKLANGVIDWTDGQLDAQGDALVITQRGLVIRAVGQGQRFQPVGRCRSTISELLREQGVPPWVRPRLPALWSDERLCWVAGLGWDGTEDYAHWLALTWMPTPDQVL